MKCKWIVFMAVLGWFLCVGQISEAVHIHDKPEQALTEHHHHASGEWMVSYQHMYMDMPTNYSGSETLTVGEVLQDYMMAPVDMTMQMHMVGLMYGFSEEFTGMLMFPYIEKNMEMRRRMDGRQMSMQSSGVGDLRLSSSFSLIEHNEQALQLNLGVSLPTGSIDQTDDTFAGPDQNLPYPMQLGSGTVDLHPGFVYNKTDDQWSWGSQFASILRFGKNDQKYRLGNKYDLTGWLSYGWRKWINTSFKAQLSIWENIEGADPRLNPMMMPTADPALRAGERVDLFIGVNVIGNRERLHGQRLVLEVGYPVYQHLDGPQLGAGLQTNIAWTKTW